MKKVKIYLSGAYTAATDAGVDANIEVAKVIAVKLWKMGYAVLCPHTNTARFEKYDPSIPYDDYLEGDKVLIEGVDAVVMLPDWEYSRGAKLEKEYADKLHIPVYYYPDLPPKENVPKSVLTEAQDLIHGPRQAMYGHPSKDFSRTAQLWSGILGQSITAEQVALCMIAVKLSRMCQTPNHRDSLIDICGYAGTIEMLWEKIKL